MFFFLAFALKLTQIESHVMHHLVQYHYDRYHCCLRLNIALVCSITVSFFAMACCFCFSLNYAELVIRRLFVLLTAAVTFTL